jgi:BirA family transcriptional regulator, biotin operon repressor / biotin---[acetyl-CoA-carboxylase] ligase
VIHRYRVLPSTMIEASRLASEGAPQGTAVVADEQTAGQGRLGRTWHSAPGDGLYVTVVLRMPELKPAITMALGVAVADAIEEVSGVKPDLRWPNDILIGDRKLAGILTQYEHGAVLAGIGVNVNHVEFPVEVRDIATSLRVVTGREHDREDLLQAILRRVQTANSEVAIRDFAARSSYVYGRRVSVDLGHKRVYGTTAGLNDAGFLILRKDDGSEMTIFAGGVRPA